MKSVKSIALVYDGIKLTTKNYDYDKSYEFLKDSVDGYIDHLVLPVFGKKHIDMWVNDEGKLLNLEPSMVLTHDGKPIDVVVGNIVFTRYDDEGDTLSLEPDDITYINDVLDNVDYLIHSFNGKMMMLPCLEV